MPKCPFKKISIVRCVLCTIFLLFLIVYHHINFFDIVERIERKPGIIYLLQWTSPKTEPFVFMRRGMKTFTERKCQVANCFVTANKYGLGDVKNFDALLFHAKEFMEAWIYREPRQRNEKQKYVFASLESSGNYPARNSIIVDNNFNLTWTYKLDSDINFGYIAIRNKSGHHIGPKTEMQWTGHNEMLPINDNIKNKLENKRIAAAWFVSNCNTVNKREIVAYEIFMEMMFFGLTLDIYGGCGNKICPRRSMKECLKMIQRDYYFYLAFENSNAEDYVTEKLLTPLNNYAVPVVFGGANYTRFMPDGIYLDVMKLGIKGVVREMRSAIQDKSKYHDYFKWHNHYSYHNIEDSPDTDPYCKLCEYLNKMINRTNVIGDLSNWWNTMPQQQLVEQLNITAEQKINTSIFHT